MKNFVKNIKFSKRLFSAQPIKSKRNYIKYIELAIFGSLASLTAYGSHLYFTYLQDSSESLKWKPTKAYLELPTKEFDVVYSFNDGNKTVIGHNLHYAYKEHFVEIRNYVPSESKRKEDEVQIYYDPSNPTKSSIYRGPEPMAFKYLADNVAAFTAASICLLRRRIGNLESVFILTAVLVYSIDEANFKKYALPHILKITNMEDLVDERVK